METTIDAAGRVVIPKKLRDLAGLKPGMALEILVEDGGLRIERAPIRVRVEQRGAFAVLVAPPGVPTVTAAQIDAAVNALRERRDG